MTSPTRMHPSATRQIFTSPPFSTMRFLKKLTPALFGGIALLLSSCAGYRLGGDKPSVLANVHKIAVPLFQNNTLEPRSSVIVTNHMIRQIQMDPTYQVTSVADADAVLRGNILRFERRQLRGVRTNTLKSRELEIKLWVDYRLENAKTGESLVKGTAQGSTSVFLDPNFQTTERQSIDEAARKASEEILARIAEGW